LVSVAVSFDRKPAHSTVPQLEIAIGSKNRTEIRLFSQKCGNSQRFKVSGWLMRIVSLISSATEILFAIGAGEDVVAISHECDFPLEAAHLPRATRSLIDSSRPSQDIDDQVKRRMEADESLYEIDRDLIRQLEPDLIVTQAQCDVCAVRYQDVIDFVAAEPAVAATNVLALNPSSVREILEDVLRVGRAAGRSDGALQFHNRLRERSQHVVNVALKNRSLEEPRVAVLEWTEPLMGAGNWTPELVQAAGGIPLLGIPGQHSTYIGWPEIVAARPDVLIVAPCGFNLQRSMIEAQRLEKLAGFRDLPAVANSRAFVVDGNAYLNRSGPRIVDSLEILAHLIRPDLFAPPEGELAEGRAWTRL
jgi:iron complex transport system substrate-binding protein